MNRRNSSAREMNATAGPASGTRDAAVCRCCASSDDAVTYDVFTGTCTNGQTYCDVLMECAPIQVSKDERLPATVCYACVSFLERFVAFRAKCFETDAILRAEPTIKREAADEGGATRTPEANPDGPCESVEIKDEPVDDAEAYSEACDCSWSPAAKAEPVDDDTGSPCEGAGVRERDPGGERRRHECDRCGKSFVQKKYLKVHLTVHTGEKPFKCAECGKSFRAKQNLLWHGYVHSGEARPHECDLCERSFLQRTQLDAHRNVHTGEKPFACGLCDATFRSKRQLGSHGRVHEKAAGRTPAKRTARVRTPGEKAERRAVRYECKACDKLYVRKEHLDLHLKIHADDRPFACGECGRSFALKRQLALHGHVHARKKSNGERERLDDSHGTDARKTFGCDVCGKKYVRESRLDFHRRTHAGERHGCSHTGEKKPYECDVRTKGFFCDSKLAEHVAENPIPFRNECDDAGDGEPFECDSCGRSYPQSVSLDVHEKIDERLGNVASHRRPSGNADEGRTYECDSCDRKYRTKNGLEYHLKTHADERRFERDLRDERFVSPSHSVQRRVHAGEQAQHAGGRPHACDSCDRTFLYRGSLDAHRRTHAAFKTKHGGNRESKFEACAKPDREDFEVSDERVAIPPDTVGEEVFSTDVERDSAE